MKVIQIFSSLISSDTKRQLIKFLGMGKNDVQEVDQVSPSGFDSAPIAKATAVYGKTSSDGDSVVIGYFVPNAVAGPGESRMFSVNSDGEVQTYIHAKSDGILEVGGNDDFMVRYSELKSGFDALKADFNALVVLYNAHVHITTATVQATPTPGILSPTLAQGTTSTASIAASKINEIKTS